MTKSYIAKFGFAMSFWRTSYIAQHPWQGPFCICDWGRSWPRRDISYVAWYSLTDSDLHPAAVMMVFSSYCIHFFENVFLCWWYPRLRHSETFILALYIHVYEWCSSRKFKYQHLVKQWQYCNEISRVHKTGHYLKKLLITQVTQVKVTGSSSQLDTKMAVTRPFLEYRDE